MVQVFSTPLCFSRQTATFVDRSNSEDGHSRLWTADAVGHGVQHSPSDAATDEHREQMMLWARTERLPIFLRYRPTNKYCELQLCSCGSPQLTNYSLIYLLN